MSHKNNDNKDQIKNTIKCPDLSKNKIINVEVFNLLVFVNSVFG